MATGNASTSSQSHNFTEPDNPVQRHPNPYPPPTRTASTINALAASHRIGIGGPDGVSRVLRWVAVTRVLVTGPSPDVLLAPIMIAPLTGPGPDDRAHARAQVDHVCPQYPSLPCTACRRALHRSTKIALASAWLRSSRAE
jgi:hypothetical protein